MITVFEQTVTKMYELNRNLFERLVWRGGWYRITLDPVLTWPGQMSSEMKTWIKENIKAKVQPTLMHDVFNIFFMRKQDAMAFKLRWM